VRLVELERRLASLDELQRIVDAMRSIASMRVQEAARSLSSVRAYGMALEQAVRESLAIAIEQYRFRAGAPFPGGVGLEAGRPARRLPLGQGMRSGRARRALVVLTSEHGFVGAFNERLLDAAASEMSAAQGPAPLLMILGSRGAALAQDRDLNAAWTGPMATRLASIPETVRNLQERLYPLIASGAIARARVMFGRYQRTGAGSIEARSLFPLELADGALRGAGEVGSPAGLLAKVPPLHHLAASDLLEGLTAEYLLARLTEATIESLASENGARFAAMDSAHENVGRKLEQYRLAASRARQEEVTTELMDLVTGAQAVD
jgi:F-type H+-transporting ATPase subunit gamma